MLSAILIASGGTAAAYWGALRLLRDAPAGSLRAALRDVMAAKAGGPPPTEP